MTGNRLEMVEREKWQFWIDRGGTFTDVIALAPDGRLTVHKLLSVAKDLYADAAIEGIKRLLNQGGMKSIEDNLIEGVRMGTTIGTNALLERKGDRTLLVVNRGFGDALRIAYQNRPDIFALEIVLPSMLYEHAIEISGRMSADGEEVEALNLREARALLQAEYERGFRSVAIVLMHSDRYPGHERQIAALAREIGFSQISASHDVSPLIKFVSRGDTTVADAYLTPLLTRYLDELSANLPATKLFFMQSNGSLTPANRFRGRDCLLSGPAGGVVAAAKTAKLAGYDKVIGFDMGGTSTDVSHYAGEYERSLENVIAGVRIRAPMMAVHTVAAGGGSILSFDGERCRVGPHSAGADPGPACYRKGGPLTVTDCNVMLGRVQPQFFPRIFGARHDQAIDLDVVHQKFSLLKQEMASASGCERTAEEIAEGFLEIAVETMANAVRKISTERGYDLRDYALAAFGGAGGQHACAMAEKLGIRTILIHPLAGVLSAFGIGIADTGLIRNKSIEMPLDKH
ncbi:MAG TPA: hydantoinase/oxoprolinase family protein, partial [Candidatus Obscuribacterales bacterium]